MKPETLLALQGRAQSYPAPSGYRRLDPTEDVMEDDLFLTIHAGDDPPLRWEADAEPSHPSAYYYYGVARRVA